VEPLSTASRAARAERAWRLADALTLWFEEGYDDRASRPSAAGCSAGGRPAAHADHSWHPIWCRPGRGERAPGVQHPEKEFERVGGTQTIHVDSRAIAATNKVLLDEVEKGHFRAVWVEERRHDCPSGASHVAILALSGTRIGSARGDGVGRHGACPCSDGRRAGIRLTPRARTARGQQ
jgi:hypothetical protein